MGIILNIAVKVYFHQEKLLRMNALFPPTDIMLHSSKKKPDSLTEWKINIRPYLKL